MPLVLRNHSGIVFELVGCNVGTLLLLLVLVLLVCILFRRVYDRSSLPRRCSTQRHNDDLPGRQPDQVCRSRSATPPPAHPSMSYSAPTDWKTKYYEVADMLAETRAELDEFHTSSKELEEELIKEIERTEKAQQDLKVKVSRVETERDEWKVRRLPFITSNTCRTPLPSPSSCPCRPPTTQQPRLCSANWIQ